jgi:hypothetical protein
LDGSLQRTRRLLAALREIEHLEPVGHVLSHLHLLMSKRGQLDTFEAFQMCVLAKQRVQSQELLQKLLLPQILASRRFHLLNKFTRTPLCNSGGPAPESQATPLSVQLLASLRVKLIATTLQLELGPVRADGSLGASKEEGTEWMVRAHDHHQVRIYSQQGIYERR